MQTDSLLLVLHACICQKDLVLDWSLIIHSDVESYKQDYSEIESYRQDH